MPNTSFMIFIIAASNSSIKLPSAGKITLLIEFFHFILLISYILWISDERESEQSWLVSSGKSDCE